MNRIFPVIILLFISVSAFSQIDTCYVDFNIKRGFYTTGFNLQLTTSTPGGIIRYTLDGSKPTILSGMTYQNPIAISGTSMVRAFTYCPGKINSKIKTHTFIFPEQVIRQKNNMLKDYGYDYSTAETGKVFWTEEMDTKVVDAPEYKTDVLLGLQDIPTLSIVMKKDDLWGANGIHWGANLDNTTDAFERECSVEMIYPEGYKGYNYNSWQENCGIKIQGGGGRWDDGIYDHKQSFTLVFKNNYGAGKLKNEIFADAPHGKETAPGKYDKIILRSGHNKGWGTTWDREKTVYTRDQLGRDLQILMSGFGSHGTFVHLYLNGKYWGLYNPCERPDDNYLANKFGGESEDYFYAKGKDPKASDDRIGEPGQIKTRFYEACAKNYNLMTYQEMQNWVMTDQSIACFLVYGYANPGDGPQYYYGNNNNPAGPVVWTPWDVEDSFGGGSRRTGPPSVANMLDDKATGDNGFKAFWTNIDFRMRFNDLVYKHFFNNGTMTDANVVASWDRLTNYIYKAIVCESARWGDERGTLMDRDNEWNAARLAVRNDMNGRASDFIAKLKSDGYYSALSVPKYWFGTTEIDSTTKNFSQNITLKITREGSVGDLYYTLDNSDPRKWDLSAGVSNSAIKANNTSVLLNLQNSIIIKSRIKNGNDWSPLHELTVNIENTASDNSYQINNVLLYPNPVADKVYISIEKKYTIFTSSGIYIGSGKGTEINMSNYQNGLYLIIIENKTFKVVKL